MKIQISAFIAAFAFVAIAHAQKQVTVGKVGSKSLYLLESATPPASFDDAVKACESKGLRLASIDNSRENELVGSFLKKRAPTATVYNALLGSKRSGGKWVWIGSNKPLSYTNWGADEPNTGEYSNCMYMTVGEAKWTATYCDIGYGLPLCQSV